ncbi:MAG: alpha-amylase family protein [Trueperella sp.]|nr:alpha-amylase family protein [Trueperella sp.]
MQIDHAIWWQIYPLGALGAPIRNWENTPGVAAPRLRKIAPWLDYAVNLGCNGILLAPIFQSSTHGYDTTDYFQIDPRLGNNSDFDWLINQATARGLAVILDGVFNHVGVQHPLAQAAQAGESDLVLMGADGWPQHWEGNLDLAELDHQNPAVADLVVEVMEYWLARGIAGWRLDVAYAVPVEFWAQVIDRVRENYPHAVFLGEMIHGDYPDLIERGHLDTVTQYELWKAIWSSIKDRNFYELDHALRRHQEFSDRGLMQIFVGNHDVSRIASTLGDAGAALAATILFTLPGLPSVYQGDEQAFRGEKGSEEWADDALRTPLPDTPEELSDLGWWMFQTYQKLIGARRRHPWLTRATVTVTAVANEELQYLVTGQDGEELQVSISISAGYSATLTFADEELAIQF